MLQYKVGDVLCCQVETIPGKAPKILMGEPRKDALVSEACFQVIAKDETMRTYMLLVDSNMTGWTIGVFHHLYMKVPKALVGKKFWDLPEQFVTKKK